MTSDDMLSESKRPDAIVFIGGGVISLEFGHVYARAGSSVTILESLPQLLPAMDADAVARLQAESERIGLQIRRLRLTKAISSATISLMDRSKARTTRALRLRSIRFLHLPLSDWPRPPRRRRAWRPKSTSTI
jgi:pyruvate/2-oxoglutarate dehydrogenase complex dihydrolipoamide dehydrogenase (E3) component